VQLHPGKEEIIHGNTREAFILIQALNKKPDKLIRKNADVLKKGDDVSELLPDKSVPMPKSKQVRPIKKERRASPRIPASKVIPHGMLRFPAGQEVELIDINVDDGLRIRSKIMLKPGSAIRLRLDVPGASYSLGGSVQRCRIFNIRQEEIQYEAAVILDEIFPLQLNAELHKIPRRPLYAWLSMEKSSLVH
jgi:hypothetical protein